MTREERREYRDRIGEMATVQEWARFRAEHQARMTDQERKQLRERLRNATP